MTGARHYDTLEFPDYLDGTSSGSVALWHAQPQGSRTSGTAAQSPTVTTGLLDGETPDISFARDDALTRRLLGVGLATADYPGGKGRGSWRLRLADGRSVIASRRENPTRSLLDARVLQVLHQHGAPVPEPLAYNGVVLIQEDVGDLRLSEPLLHGAHVDDYSRIARALIDSLWEVYRAADRAGLVDHVPVIGRTDDWVLAFVDRTALIGNRVGAACPCPDVQRLEDLLRVYTPEFVKWDARPANAMQRADGRACWIDWEHCGARHRLDDLAWILADDSMPSYPDAEMAIIEDYLPRYASGALGSLSREYLFAFGANHAANRLARILANKGDDPWQAEDVATSTDEERVRLSEAVGLCRRAARWSAQTKTMRGLSTWFGDVAAHLENDGRPVWKKRRSAGKRSY